VPDPGLSATVVRGARHRPQRQAEGACAIRSDIAAVKALYSWQHRNSIGAALLFSGETG
jgi:hypothetical protein